MAAGCVLCCCCCPTHARLRRNRKLNDAIGRLSITLYAYFDYDMLHKNHWRHHNHTGQPHKDPDFHRGNTNLLAWFGR